MVDIYKPPESDLGEEASNNTIVRPKSVFVIGILFIGLAILDFGFSVNSGFVYKTIKYDASGSIIGTGIKVELLWIILYLIGSGLMRGGKLARVIASISGIIALVIPGGIIIYYLYFSDAKNYFNSKKCPDCGDTSYTNHGYRFASINCKKCKKPLDLKNA